METTTLEFIENLHKAGIKWQLCVAETTELSTYLYFQNTKELYNYLATNFTIDEMRNILYTGGSGIRVVRGVQYTLYSV